MMTILISETGYCPYCGDFHKHYGTVDTPPISTQIRDSVKQIQRKYLAYRYRCPKYEKLYDTVVVNEVVS